MPSKFRYLRWYLILLACACLSRPVLSTSSPPPPPPTLDDTVRGATLIFVDTSVELLPRDNRGNAFTQTTADATAQPYFFYLRVRADEILYCAEPCPKQSEVIIAPQLLRNDREQISELFLNKPQIFVLIDRPFGMGLPLDLRDKWYARGTSIFNWFQPLEARSAVVRAIERYKRTKPHAS